MNTAAAAPGAAIYTRIFRYRTLLVAGAVLLWFAVATAAFGGRAGLHGLVGAGEPRAGRQLGGRRRRAPRSPRTA